jgi:Bacteriophage protein of unknown function (DUF646).
MPLDYKEFKQFYENCVSLAEELESWLVSFLLENAQWVEGITKERTPVDTGYLKKRWRITNVYRLPSTNSLGFSLINDADYASYVELGHTTRNREGWVEGYFMATISMEELNRKLPRRFTREFNKLLAKYGVL